MNRQYLIETLIENYKLGKTGFYLCDGIKECSNCRKYLPELGNNCYINNCITNKIAFNKEKLEVHTNKIIRLFIKNPINKLKSLLYLKD